MVEEWRFIDTGKNDAFYNMAMDEAIAIARSRNLVPNTVRFFRWQPSAVSIGYFQSLEEEVDISVCKKNNINCVRRRTGGGAVYHDTEGELTYSMIIDEGHRLISRDILGTYDKLCLSIIAGLRNLNIPAEFEPINDILVQGKKISGNAQTRKNGVAHQHGTILREVDPSLMFSLLKVPNEKIRDKMIKRVEERVTSIDKYLNRVVSFGELKTALKLGIEEVFKIRLVPTDITEFEIESAEDLESKYKSQEWNFKR